VAALVEKVREERRPASPPTLQTWTNLATLTGAERLVWVDARPLSGTIEVKSVLFDRRTQTVHHAGSVRLREAELRGGAAGLLQRGLARLQEHPLSSRELDKPPVTAVRPHRPWYRRWWVWTLAGAVVLGGTTTAVVLTTRDRKTNYDLRVGF
jgi:hypothetical protein